MCRSPWPWQRGRFRPKRTKQVPTLFGHTEWRVLESHQASKAYEASLGTGPPAANQTGEPNEKGHARMRPRMAFCIGITDGDQPSASPCLVVYVQLYPQNHDCKERLGRYRENITYIRHGFITLHHSALWKDQSLPSKDLSRWIIATVPERPSERRICGPLESRGPQAAETPPRHRLPVPRCRGLR